tara:strand:+ start:1020 stop:1280 length:261 start_codon:yes stop_codon:yes gene_type:complete
MPTYAGLEVQSVIFDKRLKWTTGKAKNWLLKNNYKTQFYGKPVDETINYLRYRQKAPHHFKSYITKRLKKSKSHRDNGIQLILGRK